jgi:hypothetical protein
MPNSNPLPAEDRPPDELSLADRLLSRQLEASLDLYLYSACIRDAWLKDDPSLQDLFDRCQWYVTMQTDAPTLAISCPDLVTSWQVLENLVRIGSLLERLAIAKLRVCPPADRGTPLEIRVAEISVYREEL